MLWKIVQSRSTETPSASKYLSLAATKSLRPIPLGTILMCGNSLVMAFPPGWRRIEAARFFSIDEASAVPFPKDSTGAAGATAGSTPPLRWGHLHAALAAGGRERVGEQACDRHRADATGHRRDAAGARQRFGEGDVAHEPRLAGIIRRRRRNAVDADIDDGGALADPIAFDHLGLADGGNDDL